MQNGLGPGWVAGWGGGMAKESAHVVDLVDWGGGKGLFFWVTDLSPPQAPVQHPFFPHYRAWSQANNNNKVNTVHSGHHSGLTH